MLKNIYVGFDRDGTLEMPGYPIPSKLIEQFHALEKIGIKLFLASGKDLFLLQKITRDISLNAWMICAENGGHITIPSKNVNYIKSDSLDLSEFKLKIHTVKLPPYKEEPKSSIWSKKFGDHVLEAELCIKNFIHENGWELNVYSYPDGDGGLDVVPVGIDKVNLLPYIPMNSTIYYMGDGENDLGLLLHERIIPCTVSNAKKEIQENVLKRNGHVSAKIAGHGVSEILTKLFSI